MAAKSVADYHSLITSEHADKRRFMDTIEASIAPLSGLQYTEFFAIAATAIDFAVGVQLDWIGEWVGITRRVPTPITGVYFTWNDTAVTGWNSGVWKGPYDPGSWLTELPDEDYRILIRAKIVANNSIGTTDEIYAILDAAFPGNTIDITDGQDMTMTVTYTIADFTPVQEAILTQGLIPIKPAGVGITYTGV